jgi:purine-cytosine permease-like protein
MPLKTPRWKLFVSTYIGIAVPTILVQTLGVAIYSGAQANPAWKHAFVEYGIGGPLQKALEPAGGFGKLCLVFAALSSVANNIPNNYAFANHAQNAGPWAIKVPRIAFVTLGYIAAIIVGCFAAKYFEDTLQTFLSVIGYWTIIHLVVVVEEHVIFRRARYGLYDWDAWDKPELLPFGWGAIGGFAFGFLGAALGMKTAWYVAPIAKLVGPKGANLGHEFTFAFSAVAFPAFRWLEKKYGGK